jgi:hypothetical protein
MFTDQHQRWIENRKRVEAEQKLSYAEGVLSQPGISDNNSDSRIPIIQWTSDASSNQETILEIKQNDVLFGRGKTVVEHVGNLRFRNIVRMAMDKYENANRMEKTHITEKIVGTIKETDGRFLKRDDGGEWEEVDHETARKKVAHAFRNRRKLYPGLLS